MAKQSVGLLVYRQSGRAVEVLLVHPGGPFFARRDNGVWSIPKGELEEGEDKLAAARREFTEELGLAVPQGPMIDLGSIKQKSGKTVYAWAVPGDLDCTNVVSNTFRLEWPPRSGKQQEFPEIDRAAWFDSTTALSKLTPGQDQLVRNLLDHLDLPLPLEQASLF